MAFLLKLLNSFPDMPIIPFHKMPRIAMTMIGLVIVGLSCREPVYCKAPVEKMIPVSGFRSATSPPSIIFYVNKGKEITVRAKGCAQDIADLDLKVTDSVLDVRFKDYKSVRAIMEIFITTPVGADVNFFKVTKVRETREPGT